MPTYALLERQRVRERSRARPNTPGNYITSQKYAQWYSLTFDKTDKHYQASALIKDVYQAAIGYYNAPTPKPPWVPLEKLSSYQNYTVVTTPVEPPRVPPSNIPPGVNPVLPISAQPGSQGTVIIAAAPQQLYPTKLAIRRVTILALSGNAGDITTGYDQTIASGRGFRLTPGAARDYDIDDLSQLWLVSTNGTDQIDYIFEV